jgi:uncharacterized membrane protein
MKIIYYYLALLVLLALITYELTANTNTETMSMPAMVSVSVLLVGYVVAMSLIGEGKATDEREIQHRYFANRAGLIAGTTLLSIGVLYQLFTHRLDYWLLAGLLTINVVKIISLLYLHYRK